MLNSTLKSLIAPTTPKQRAIGIALGSIIALTPWIALHNFVVLFLIFFLNVSILPALLTAFLLKPIGLLLTPIALLIGEYLLIDQPALILFWERLQSLPLIPLFQLNNTLVLGGLILAIFLSIPIAWVGDRLIKQYQKKWKKKINQNKLYANLSKAKCFNWLKKNSPPPISDIHQKQKIFRWKTLIPFGIIVLGMGVFSLLFLEPFLKSRLERHAQRINQAPVEIGKLDIQLTKLGASLHSIQFANENDLSRNLFQIENLNFNLEASPLLFGKIHIKQAKITGLTLNTTRDLSLQSPMNPQPSKSPQLSNKNRTKKSLSSTKVTSIPPKQKKPSPPQQTVKKTVEKNNLADSQNSSKTNVTSIDVATILSSNDLDIEEKIKQFKTQVENQTEDLEKKIESAVDLSELRQKYSNVQHTVNFTEASINSNESPMDQTNLEKIQELKKNFDDKKEALAKIETELKTNQKQLNKEYQKLLKLKDDQLKKLLNSFKRNSPQLKNITDLILREVIHRKVQEYFFHYQNYRQVLDASPASLRNHYRQQKQKRGVTVDFSRGKSAPIFWIKQTDISGKITSTFSLTGKLLDVSSDLSYRPMTISLTGGEKNSTLKLTSHLEKNLTTQKISNESILDWKNYDLRWADFITQSPYIKKINRGQVNMRIELNDDGEWLKLDGKVTGRNVSLEVGEAHETLKPILKKTFKRLPQLKASFQFSARQENGVVKQSDLILTSNLDEILKSKLKQYFEEQSQQERQELITAYNKKIREILAPIDEKLGTQLNEKLDRGVGDLNAWVGDIEKIQAHILKELKKKDVQENIKREIDKYLPKETADEVKDFLKKNFF